VPQLLQNCLVKFIGRAAPTDSPVRQIARNSFSHVIKMDCFFFGKSSFVATGNLIGRDIIQSFGMSIGTSILAMNSKANHSASPGRNHLCWLGTLFVFVCGAWAAEPAARWSQDQANNWRQKTDWLVGCDFLPSTAINQLEMFQAETFDLPTYRP
jgi:hypothetical protein